LGSPIHSDQGDIWHVFIDPAGAPLGFALTHIFKTTDTAHIRFLFVPSGMLKIQDALLKGVIVLAKEHGLKSVYTYDRKDSIWEKAGFKKHKKPRSSFYKWEKSL
jgi:N-acetylglutamate synthase-like GNAT family acetyltransferase